MDFSKHWKKIIDRLQDGIIIVDTGGVIQETNPSAERLTGYSQDELLGSSCRILNCTGCKIIGRGKGVEYCKLFSVGQSKVKKCRIKNKKNLSVHILKSASVLEDENGEAIGAVEVLTDMTSIIKKQEEIESLKTIFHFSEGLSGIIGKTPVMEQLFQLIKSVSQSDAPVLIQGESGTGKELVALSIHNNSPRKDQPFIKVNCAALNENLFESELFGHVKGAYTGAEKDRIGRFEAAHGGTIFLDEIGEIPMSIQVKLLRVLEEKEVERVGDHNPFPVDVRIVSATNRNLEKEIKKGNFRKDLFFRVNVFPLQCPPLSERKEDIPLIVQNFIDQNSSITGKEIIGVSPEVMDTFIAYSWPGNVRELRNAIEYSFVLCPGGLIEEMHIPHKIIDPGKNFVAREQISPQLQSERDVLLHQLRKTRGNQSKLARLLGISRVTLWKRIKKYGIRIPEDI